MCVCGWGWGVEMAGQLLLTGVRAQSMEGSDQKRNISNYYFVELQQKVIPRRLAIQIRTLAKRVRTFAKQTQNISNYTN